MNSISWQRPSSPAHCTSFGKGRCAIPLSILLIAVALGSARVAIADTQDPSAFKSDVSRTAVTTMPAYTVEEANSAKTHTLFMGADIAINLDRDLYNVRDVWGSNWVIDINGREKEIAANRAPVNLKITPNLKLTESSVTIVGFKRVRAYSFGNDPSVRLTRGLNQSAVINSDLSAVAENAQNRADVEQNHALGGAALLAGSDDQFSANAMETTAQYAYSNSHTTGINAAGLPVANGNPPSTTTSTTGNTLIQACLKTP